MDEVQPTFSRQESLQRSEEGGGFNFLWVVIFIVVVGLIGGGVFFLRSRQNNEQVATLTPTPTFSFPTSTPTPEQSPTPTASPSATPKPVTPTPTKKPTPTQKVATTAADLKRQAISVQILNGSGIAGAAQKVSDYLSGFSYTISAVGNADSYDFEKTAIQTKTADSLTLLKTDLGAQYEIGTASATLPSSSPYDAVVTVGKK